MRSTGAAGAPRSVVKESFQARLGALALALVALVGVFEPGTLEALFWLHLEVVVLGALLILGSLVARTGGALAMQLLIAAVATPFILALTLGSWLVASLLFSGGGPAALDGQPLMAATAVLLEEGLSPGLEALWRALGPGAGWLVAGSALFHVVVTVARSILGRVALERREPPLDPEHRADAEDALQPSALLLGRAFFQAGGLFVASLLTVVPVALAVVSLDDRAPWPSWLIIVGVRLGLEAWRVAMDRIDPKWVRKKHGLQDRSPR